MYKTREKKKQNKEEERMKRRKGRRKNEKKKGKEEKKKKKVQFLLSKIINLGFVFELICTNIKTKQLEQTVLNNFIGN